MRCIDPIRMKNPLYPEFSTLRYIDCACGKCFNCLVNRRRMWFFRLFWESIDCVSTFFVGLDYRPADCDMNLHRDHLRNFFKKLRKYGLKFRYYAIGEFGTDDEHTHRPHYHILFFLDSHVSYDQFKDLCESAWKYGRVDIGDVEPRSINYVLHYHVRPKRPFGDDDPRETFSVASNGLGLNFLEYHYHDIVDMLTSSLSRKVTDPFGDSFVLPRYYVKKLKDFGLNVKEFDGSCVDYTRTRMRDLIELLDSSVEFFSDGCVKPEFEERYDSLYRDIIANQKRKLKKYDTQDKFSSK